MSKTFSPPPNLLFCFSGWCCRSPGTAGCVPQTCWGLSWQTRGLDLHHTGQDAAVSQMNRDVLAGTLRMNIQERPECSHPCVPAPACCRFPSGRKAAVGPAIPSFSDGSDTQIPALFPISFVPPVGDWVVKFSQPETRTHFKCIIFWWNIIYNLFIFFFCLV